MVEGFKAFDSNFCCRGFQYEVGKEYRMEEDIVLCEKGFHFCRELAQVFRHYKDTNNRYAEVEALGKVVIGNDKCVTNHIRIVREIPREEVLKMLNIGHLNNGIMNTGSCNTGKCNTGSFNVGSFNNGSFNFGSRNTGKHNWGNANTDNNNRGSFNTGSCNTGDCNSGDCNFGFGNSGSRNRGDYNAGDFNTSDGNSGCFNTKAVTISMFNRPSNWTLKDWDSSDACSILSSMPVSFPDTRWVPFKYMTDADKEGYHDYAITDGYLDQVTYKADCQAWWDELPDSKKETVMALPNFDADIFYECTGIRVQAGK